MSTEKKDGDVRAVVAVVIIATICAAGLALVKGATQEAIEKSAIAEKADALNKVVPKGCTVQLMELAWPPSEKDPKKQLTIDPAFDAQGNLCALAVKSFDGKAYGGRIEVLAGFKDLDSKESLRLNRIYVLKHSETPGLGSKAAAKQDEDPASWGDDPKAVFGVNFRDKDANKLTFQVKKEGAGPDDVAAITASTITSRAVAKSVERARDAVRDDLDAIRKAVDEKKKQ